MSNQVAQASLMMCSFGGAPCPLVVPNPTVTACGQNAANIMDHVFPVNVSTFGMCTTPSNPAVAAALGAPSACIPQLPAPWIPGKPTVLVRGAPALDSSSKLMCAYGGVISITLPSAPTVNLG